MRRNTYYLYPLQFEPWTQPDPMDGPAGDGVDRISTLPDELLHVILARVRRALEVTRTAALSRRWRRVWIHARELSVVDDDLEYLLVEVARDGAFVGGFLDWVLAQRGDADMNSLRISMKRGDCPPPDQINAWIRYGAQRVVGDFYLRVPMGSEPHLNAVKLPEHGRPGSISLHLPFHAIQFPPAAVARYEALTALSLQDVSFAEDKEGRGLSGFVSSSSCCPRLRTLYMKNIWQLTQLVLRVEALEELTVIYAANLVTLDMAAPNLRVFDLLACYQARTLRVVAPRLQEIDLCRIDLYRHPQRLDIHCLASVRRLRKIEMDIHAQRYSCDTGFNFWLLENCTGVENVEFYLRHANYRYLKKNKYKDLAVEGAPRFPHVRSMFMEAKSIHERQLVASISSLLRRFPGLRSLHIEIIHTDRGILECFCRKLDTCYDHGNISLGFLEEVEISGFTGADEEMDLVTLIFKISPSVKSMTLYATLETGQNSEDGHGDDSLEPSHHKLMSVSSSDRGHWHFGKSVCTWAVIRNREHIIAGAK